ncbi:hypothetical protein K443DRAFT_116682, partial [Laccaria amethystina LaAM-08-1]
VFVGEGNGDGSKESSQVKRGGSASLCLILDFLVSINLLKVIAPSTTVPRRLETTLLKRINPTPSQHQMQCRDSRTNPSI